MCMSTPEMPAAAALNVPSMSSALGFQVGGAAIRNGGLGRLALRAASKKKVSGAAEAAAAINPLALQSTRPSETPNPDLNIPEDDGL